MASPSSGPARGLLLLGLQLAATIAPAAALPAGCRSLVATSTDPLMRWFCQSGPPGSLVPGPYRTNNSKGCVGSWHPWNNCGWQCTNRHIACAAAPQAPLRPQLAVFLPGTGLCPHAYSQLLADFASHGFHTLGLQYPSGEGQRNCGASRAPAGHASTDLNCTARQRLRVLTGANFSYGQPELHTNVTFADSIVNRIAKALLALGPPWSGWVSGGEPDWPKIVIAGHSNGADHAAFASKVFPVARALLFAGANDDVGSAPRGHYATPAPWQFAAGATPSGRVYGFGVCPGGPMCLTWHAGWAAMGLPGPWFQAQDALTSPASALSGYHRICANGSALVERGKSAHMAAAADCCAPTFPNTSGVDASLRGRMMWTRLYEHMLTDAIGSTPAEPGSSPGACSCNSSLKSDDDTVDLDVPDPSTVTHQINPML